MSKTIIRVNKKENPFVMIDKTFLSDNRISWKAKGILAYLMSKPDNWKIIIKDLIKQSTDGETSVYSGLKELEKNGYITRKKLRDECGKFKCVEYTVYERPILPNTDESSTLSTSGFSKCGNFKYGNSKSGKSSTTNNTTLLNNNVTNNNYNKHKDIVANSLNLKNKDLEKDVQKLILVYKKLFNVKDKNIPYNVFNLIKSVQDIQYMKQAIKYLKTHYVDKNKKINNLPGLLRVAFEQKYSLQSFDSINHKHNQRIQKQKQQRELENYYIPDPNLTEQQRNLFVEEAIKIFGKDIVNKILNDKRFL